jgi:hypothetical protein
MAEITDPELLKQLNNPESHEIQDPTLLNQLNAPDTVWGKLSSGQYPALYNPRSQLLPNNPITQGPSKKEAQPRGLDMPTFGAGMSEAPGVTLGGAAAGTVGAAAMGSPMGTAILNVLKGAAPIGAGVAYAKGADWAKEAGAPHWIIKALEDVSLGNILRGTEGRK